MHKARRYPEKWPGRIVAVGFSIRPWIAAAVVLALVSPKAWGADEGALTRFRDQIQPILVDYCYGCHADGVKKGEVAFDGFPNDAALVNDRALWSSVLKNVRAGIMPPAKKPRPTPEQIRLLSDWIKRDAFGIDPKNPDPGRVTIRRLNRVEYRNTIKDLMGVDYKTDEEFPPDDTGYGFDNIGDVLTVSPLLLEKYLQAAESVVASSVPTVAKVVNTREYKGADFKGGEANGAKLRFDKPAKVSKTVWAETGGTFRLGVNLSVNGSFDFDPGRCRLVFKAGDRELIREEFKWEGGKKFAFEFKETWKPGFYPLTFEVEPLNPPEKGEKRETSIDLRITAVVVEGPLEPEHWTRSKNFDRFFFKDAPASEPERRAYVREVLARFTKKAYRRPTDARHLDRLVAVAESVYSQPGKSVEQGVAQAIVAALASPRFLFRLEGTDSEAPAGEAFSLVDEYALASRLSYFLWSTMPDEALFDLAERGELRKNLPAQVKRMLGDPRSEMLIRNFTGQWLQARDVEGIAIDPRTVLARDAGDEKELKKEQEEFRAFLAEREAQSKKEPRKGQQNFAQIRRGGRFQKLFGPVKVELDAPLREAMRRETEMFFGSVVREDRSVLDLLDSDYTFLNERLAKHYGVPDVTGATMRKVTLPKDSPRGGLLTQGTVLLVTSNPTRTSPVKRGLFILDNVLGTPPPPPPEAVAALEDSEKGLDREPTLREVLALHRNKPLCNSCHSRMDPLGLAFENFNALGVWRDKERGQDLDTAGTLITGEPFAGVRDLKRILKEERRVDFYRCLTEKLMTYALGRGIESGDVDAVDRVVERLESEGGRFSALLTGVVDSAPFQKRRNGSAETATAVGRVENPDEKGKP